MSQLKIREFKNQNNTQAEIKKLLPDGEILSVIRKYDGKILLKGLKTSTILNKTEYTNSIQSFCDDLIHVYHELEINYPTGLRTLSRTMIEINDVE